MEPLTTGTPALDELLGGLQVGDNVVLQADSEATAEAILAPAMRSTHGRPLVYVSFRLDANDVAERFDDRWDRDAFLLLDCTATSSPAPAGLRVERVPDGDLDLAQQALLRHEHELGAGVTYIFDGLTTVQARFGSKAALDLFLTTCPRLYEQRTVAYWTLEKAAHDPPFLSRLAAITQVVVDISATEDRLVAELRQAAGRPDELRGGRALWQATTEGLELVERVAGTRERVGRLIREHRVAAGMAQAELARRVGISASALSQAERGRHGLSGEVLTRVWQSLGIPFGPESAAQAGHQVFRRGGRAVETLQPGMVAETVAEDPRGARASLLLIDPGAGGRRAPFATKQSELALILAGVLELRVGVVTETLQPGDAISLSSEPVTAWRNPSAETARVLWVTT